MKEGKGISESIGQEVFINLKTDFGFKKIFGNKTLLAAFLRTVLFKDIKKIEYLPAEQLGYAREDRKAVYDVYCTTSGGKRFIVEMQASSQPNFAERLLFYMAYPIISQAPKGKVTRTNSAGKQVKSGWDYSIEGVYMVGILNFTLFPEKLAKNTVVEHVRMMRKEANIVFTDKLEFVTIELPKFRKKEGELLTIQDKWLYSLKNMEKLPECPKEFDDEILRELYENAKINNLTGEEMKAYNKSIMEYDDVILAVDYARETVEKEGEKRGYRRGIIIGRIKVRARAKAKAEGRNEVRINLVLNAYKNGISIEQIIRITGLSEEQVSAILAMP
ncbi:MAG: Rpn family recombination-promoting nuclease/putative transposase [Prevotellaceae bacterium]|jgi:predicted transposase/invertase (TIGR01784 family)|nr:Rpn family recombination-promoting nuclease/putative transposase [Prevotellaceae bacterium]